MKRPRRTVVTQSLSAAVILVFAGLLVFALVRLAQTEAELQADTGDNMLWAISRAQLASVKLDDAIARRAAGLAGAQALALRRDVMLSRLNLLRDGPQLRYLERLGHAEDIVARAATLRGMLPRLADLAPGDTEAARAFHEALAPLARDLGRAATGAMVTQWDAAGARHDTLRRATDQLIISILGIVVLGSFISVSMLRAMAARQSAQRSLEREQELRETYRTFVALASHQFQTPLSVIDASAQRLLRRGSAMPWEEVLRRAGDIRASVRQLTTLIGATLESIRLDSGQVTPDMRACNLPDLLERVRDQQLDAAPDRQVRIDIAAGVPRHITTDPFLVEQVLANLISNALKFSPGDEPVQVQVATAGAGLRFRVVDYGMGIPEAARGRVFEDFFRSVLARGVPGNGIGLNLARKIAELLGGSLVLERRQGPGAVFTFDLPVVEMGAAAR